MDEHQNILRGIFGVSLWSCIIIFILIKIVYLKKGRFPYFIFLVPLLSGVFVIALDSSRVFLVLSGVPVMILLHTIYIKRQIHETLTDDLQVAFDVSIISKVRVINQKIYAITTNGYFLIDIADDSEKIELEDSGHQLHQDLMLFSPRDQLIFKKLKKIKPNK